MTMEKEKREESSEEEEARYNLIRLARIAILAFPTIMIVDWIVQYVSFNKLDYTELWFTEAMLCICLAFSTWVSWELKHFQKRHKEDKVAETTLLEK